jgi:MFS family permease
MRRRAVSSPAVAVGRRAGLHHVVTGVRTARQLLQTPASRQSRSGLDWTNFFIADIQTGFGTFVAFYLANLGWGQESVGLVLATGGLAGVLAQIPGGALTDAVAWKRGLVALGVAMICGAALILALAPAFYLVFVAEILQGLSAGFVGPALAAISLGLVGRRAMSVRTGRNYGFAAAGTALTAGALGLAGSFVSTKAIFVVAAALCAPALLALSRIRNEEIDYARARNAALGEDAGKLHRVIDVAKDRRLLLFAACLILFQFANASILPLVGEKLGASKAALGPMMMSGLIIGPQIVVALLAPWVGHLSERYRRKPLLVIGISLAAVRSALFAFVTYYPAMIAIQLLDGISGAIISVLTVLVITDLTTGTGRFNLTQGAIGAMNGIAAALSISLSGAVVQAFSAVVGFASIAVVAASAAVLAWRFLPETKPEKYLD